MRLMVGNGTSDLPPHARPFPPKVLALVAEAPWRFTHFALKSLTGASTGGLLIAARADSDNILDSSVVCMARAQPGMWKAIMGYWIFIIV